MSDEQDMALPLSSSTSRDEVPSRRRRRRTAEQDLSVICLGEDEDVPLSMRRKRRRLPVPEDESGPSDCGHLFNFLANIIGISSPRVVDTVDLSVDTFKPTPKIDEVIIVDSDVSVVQSSQNEESPSKSGGLTCAVCLDGFSGRKPPMSTFCGHVFCEPCLMKVMKDTKKCPTCRMKMKGKGYHPIFL